jgi:hypothetical protein
MRRPDLSRLDVACAVAAGVALLAAPVGAERYDEIVASRPEQFRDAYAPAEVDEVVSDCEARRASYREERARLVKELEARPATGSAERSFLPAREEVTSNLYFGIC